MKAILLIEDNDTDERLTIRALKKANISNEIVVARDGEEALDYLFGTGPFAGRDTSISPSVALLDLNLPKIGGLDVLHRVRQDDRTRRLPVVVLTSSAEEEDVIRSLRFGCERLCAKARRIWPLGRGCKNSRAVLVARERNAATAKVTRRHGSAHEDWFCLDYRGQDWREDASGSGR